MADVDPKVAQRVFKDYSRGMHLPEIAERHGLTTRAVGQVVKFESAVHSRVQQALAKAQPAATTPKKVAEGHPGGKKR